MRKSTLLWLGMAAVCSVILFSTSQKVIDGEAKLAELKRETMREEESLRVLQAEWSYLNQPDRLEKLARQYLHLQPLTGRQFATMDTIPMRPIETATEEMPVAAKEAEKPKTKAETKTVKAIKAPVLKPAPKEIRRDIAEKPKTAPKTPAVAATSPAPKRRSFNDLIEGLGVE